MHTYLLAAISIDGFIAPAESDNQRSFNWTSEADKKFYVTQIKSADVIVMGAKTFATFSRYPRDSHWIIYTSQPSEFVNPKPAVIRAEATAESPQALISRLKNEGVQRVAICGGASIYRQFVSAGVVDSLHLSVEPIVFGSGIKLFGDQPLSNNTWNLKTVEKLGDEGTVLLEYTK